MYDLTLIKTNKDEAISLSKKLGFSDIFFIQNEDIVKNLKEIKGNKLNIVLGGNDEFNRQALTNKNTTILLNPEPDTKDSLKQKNSGLNQVLCNLANKNKVAIAFSIERLQDLNLLGKIIQNIKLCKKYKVKMLFFTLARNKYELVSSYDLLSILRVLGMNPNEAKYALTGINDLIKGKSL
ncbi:MAG: RNase P subunit p30 family protein [Candidatus Nanoarchaeia archaeon]|nr:RNase P subunit p30 family protein [Candidatus Nanoarchaeia archaeon]